MIQQKNSSPLHKEQPFQQLQHIRERLREVYRGGVTASVEPVLLDELDHMIDMLGDTEKKLYTLYDTHQSERIALEQECQRYRELFAHAPVGYLITNPFGSIHQANQMATSLLQAQERLLIGRPLEYFLPKGEHRAFRTEVAELVRGGDVREWERILQPWEGTPFRASMTAMVARSETGRPVALRWLLRNSL